ncbi:uncharacterized protein LOC135817468 [Sycon ciliatum]|uniref:uncharacterized protein LOC135817468 n=1 Tax=Sycon ciliatum TaxID=27933 RepID=UPI0020A87D04|eukprot:scpid53394/ scgid28090/ 
MPVFSDPSLLTAVRLKEELTKHGVDFKPNRPKKYYVDLYSRNVRDVDESQSKLDFSSEEEVEVPVARKPVAVVRSQTRSSIGSSRSSIGPSRSSIGPSRSTSRLSVVPDDITGLSDADLRQELLEYNFEVGPISETTRPVCQRKLAEFRSKGSAKTRQSGGSRTLFSDEELDDMSGGLGDEGLDEDEPDMDDDAETDVDYGPVLTKRTWPRVSDAKHTVPTVAQAGSTPPRSTQRAGIRSRMQDQTSASGWPVRARTAPSTASRSPTRDDGRQAAVAAAATQGQVDVTDYDTVDRRSLLRRKSAVSGQSQQQQQGGISFARFLELLAVGLLGFFIVVILMFVEGPHQNLIPAIPKFPSQPDSGPP